MNRVALDRILTRNVFALYILRPVSEEKFGNKNHVRFYYAVFLPNTSPALQHTSPGTIILSSLGTVLSQFF